MRSLFHSGHTLMCPRSGACLCAFRLFLITGILAVVAGLVSGVIGYGASMALLSDAPHSLADGIADFIAAGLVLWYGKEVDDGYWHWLLAALLGAAVLYIGYEAYERITLVDYPVSGPWAFLGASFTLFIHWVRLRFLTTQEKITKLRNGVIGHVRADIRHASIAALLGVVMTILDLLNQRPLMKWFDLGLTAVLVLMLLRQTKRIAMGEGCGGHDHEHHDHAADCDHTH